MSMSVCKSCMLTGIVSALAASAVTAAVLSGSCHNSRHMRHSVNHALKNLTHCADSFAHLF